MPSAAPTSGVVTAAEDRVAGANQIADARERSFECREALAAEIVLPRVRGRAAFRVLPMVAHGAQTTRPAAETETHDTVGGGAASRWMIVTVVSSLALPSSRARRIDTIVMRTLLSAGGPPD